VADDDKGTMRVSPGRIAPGAVGGVLAAISPLAAGSDGVVTYPLARISTAWRVISRHGAISSV